MFHPKNALVNAPRQRLDTHSKEDRISCNAYRKFCPPYCVAEVCFPPIAVLFSFSLRG